MGPFVNLKKQLEKPRPRFFLLKIMPYGTLFSNLKKQLEKQRLRFFLGVYGSLLDPMEPYEPYGTHWDPMELMRTYGTIF